MKVLAGIGLAGLLGGVVGAIVAVSSWDGGAVINFLSGFLVGGLSMLILGWIMASHGSSVGGSDQQSSVGPVWGLLTGGTYGLFLGPVFGAAVGLSVGQLVGGGLLGLYLGPLAGIVAWEASFFLSRSQAT